MSNENEDRLSAAEAENYSDNGAHNMTAEERAEGIEGVVPVSREEELAEMAEVTYPIVAEPKPVMVKKSGEPLEVGHAIVTINKHQTEIHVVLDTHGGQELASFLGSKLCTAISIGGSLDPEVAAKIIAQNN